MRKIIVSLIFLLVCVSGCYSITWLNPFINSHGDPTEVLPGSFLLVDMFTDNPFIFEIEIFCVIGTAEYGSGILTPINGYCFFNLFILGEWEVGTTFTLIAVDNFQNRWEWGGTIIVI